MLNKILWTVAVMIPAACAQSSVSLSTTPNPSVFGAPVTLKATVTPSTATGRVTFFDGVTVLGTAALSSGTASLSTALLPSGTRSLRAVYGSAASDVVKQVLDATRGGGFT